MARVVYLHVGAPKTGTTYLQDRLARNRSELAKHDVGYPLGLTGSMFEAAVDLLELPWGGQGESTRGSWDALVGRVRRASGTAIVSIEILAAARPEHVKRAMESLQDAEIHLVYSARDLARQIPAEWQESLKHQRRKSFKRFLRDVQASPRRGAKLWFWRVQGLPDVLNRWADNLPPSHVHLVTVPQKGAPRDELLHRYCRALGLDPAWLPEESKRENESIGAAEAALLRALNRRIRSNATVDRAAYGRLVRELSVHQTLAHRDDKRLATLPPWAYPWATEVAEEWIEWVEGAGIDVVGDLDDLRPVAPSADRKWADPDHPPAREMVDAALDVIEVLLAEAAAKPDPAATAKKIVEVAKRLRP